MQRLHKKTVAAVRLIKMRLTAQLIITEVPCGIIFPGEITRHNVMNLKGTLVTPLWSHCPCHQCQPKVALRLIVALLLLVALRIAMMEAASRLSDCPESHSTCAFA